MSCVARTFLSAQCEQFVRNDQSLVATFAYGLLTGRFV